MKRLILAAIVVLASAYGAPAQSGQASLQIEHRWSPAATSEKIQMQEV
jgi:hypothetical protein